MILRMHDIKIREVDQFDDLVLFNAELKLAASAYADIGLPEPDWLTSKIRETRTELTVRIRDRKERQLAQLKMRREGLLSDAEKRAKVDGEIAALEKELTSA